MPQFNFFIRHMTISYFAKFKHFFFSYKGMCHLTGIIPLLLQMMPEFREWTPNIINFIVFLTN